MFSGMCFSLSKIEAATAANCFFSSLVSSSFGWRIWVVFYRWPRCTKSTGTFSMNNLLATDGVPVDLELEERFLNISHITTTWDALVDVLADILVGINTKSRSISNPEQAMDVRTSSFLKLNMIKELLQLPKWWTRWLQDPTEEFLHTVVKVSATCCRMSCNQTQFVFNRHLCCNVLRRIHFILHKKSKWLQERYPVCVSRRQQTEQCGQLELSHHGQKLFLLQLKIWWTAADCSEDVVSFIKAGNSILKVLIQQLWCSNFICTSSENTPKCQCHFAGHLSHLKVFRLPKDVGNVQAHTMVNIAQFSLEYVTRVNNPSPLFAARSLLTTPNCWEWQIFCFSTFEDRNLTLSRYNSENAWLVLSWKLSKFISCSLEIIVCA